MKAKRILLTDDEIRYLLELFAYKEDLLNATLAGIRRKLATALDVEQYDAGVERD